LARIILLEPDLVFAATLADPLEEAGHRVQAFDDALLALGVVFDNGADLFLLNLEIPGCDALDLVKALREQKETKSTPILGLARTLGSKERLRLFQAGVDEVLDRDALPEEIHLRIRRLIGDRSAESSMIAGSLGGRQLADYLQYVKHAGQSGVVEVSSGQGSGRIELYRGDVVAARWDYLRHEVALLAILSLQDGRFRFEMVAAAKAPPAGTDVFEIQPFLFRAAWLEDELAKRRSWIPGTGLWLETTNKSGAPELAGRWLDLPILRIYQTIASAGRSRLFDLVQTKETAPAEIRLALAILIEHGLVSPTLEGGPTSSTRELDIGQVFQFAVMGLIERLGKKPSDAEAQASVSLLVLAEGDALETLTALFSSVRHDALIDLVHQIEERGGGSAVLNVETGRLTLHLQKLTTATAGRLAVLLPGCDALIIWLQDAREAEGVRMIAERLESSSRQASGLIVAADPTAEELGRALVANGRRFTLSTRRPSSLTSLFRMLATKGR
jgi:DNA-binding response OmpR family regulator